MVVLNPEFGHEMDVATVEKTFRTDMLNLINGVGERQFPLRLTDTIVKTRKIAAAKGIIKSDESISPNKINGVAVTAIIDSATYIQEEVVNGPVYMPTVDYQGDGGAAAVDGDRLLYATSMLYPRTHYRLSVAGKGKIVATWIRGLVVPVATGIQIFSATDAATKIDTATAGDGVEMILNSVTGAQNEEDWEKWTLEFEGWKSNTTPWTTSPLLTSLQLFPAGGTGGDITALYDMYKITIELRLSEDRHAELTETVEGYNALALTDTSAIVENFYPIIV